jgi:hypothetical protein
MFTNVNISDNYGILALSQVKRFVALIYRKAK